MTRVSVEDLSWAAGWLLAYEGEDGIAAADDTGSGDELVQRARRVAAWLDAEVARRALEVDVTEVIRQAGGDPKDGRQRAAVRRALRGESSGTGQ